eukprot:CAMPEP_0202858050 /NCGR_PEP_ID=MMETSP1391-20130828/741_1 /ASSEMBLY_ACC=CAM_ASM_000867 /TAXON_ID=1034604 /ORGANISM="Chlamydomonas leiostraca, Strain SAG 11-49" /LENGTH=735 /DNA_ID=CAMNT_0049536921 /DNA_START=77 /DNA_END=2284 /DNA_ORIENTATION=-
MATPPGAVAVQLRQSVGGNATNRTSESGPGKVRQKLDTFEFKGMNMTEKVRRTLKQFDVNDDEQLDIGEVTALVEHLMAEERQNSQLKWAVIFLSVFACILLAGMFGLTWAVVAALKDTKTGDDGVMKVKDKDLVVQVANYETTVGANGVQLPRQNGSVVIGNTTVNNPLRAGQFMGVRLSYSPWLSTQAIMEMNYLIIKGPNTSEVLVKVDGVARIFDLTAPAGSVVKVVTPLGTFTMWNTDDMRLDTKAEQSLTDLGFTTTTVSGGGRRLLQRGNGRGNAADVLANNLPEDAVMDPEMSDFRADAASGDKGKRVQKARKAARLLEKSMSGDSAAEANIAAAYAAWKATYDNGDEESQPSAKNRGKDERERYAAFKRAMKEVLDANGADNVDYVNDLNQWSDIDAEEMFSAMAFNNIAQMLAQGNPGGGRKLMSQEEVHNFLQTPAHQRKLLQTSVNYVAQNKVSVVRNQGMCGCCFAYGALAAIEVAYHLQKGTVAGRTGTSNIRLSYGQGSFCCHANNGATLGSFSGFTSSGATTLSTYTACRANSGCSGGWPNQVLDYAAASGISDEVSTWNVGRTTWDQGATQNCPTGTFPGFVSQAAQKMYKLSAPPRWLPTNNEDAIVTALQTGPVVIAMQTTSAFKAYRGGIFNNATGCTNSPGHIMLAVGYDLNQRWMLIKNSWGQSWGENLWTAVQSGYGFARVAMIGNGAGLCGLNMYAWSLQNGPSNFLSIAP